MTLPGGMLVSDSLGHHSLLLYEVKTQWKWMETAAVDH